MSYWHSGRQKGCVAMRTGTSAGLWDVIACDSKEKYICKKIAEGVTTTKEPPVTQPLSCPSKWLKKDPGNCMKVQRLHTQTNKKKMKNVHHKYADTHSYTIVIHIFFRYIKKQKTKRKHGLRHVSSAGPLVVILLAFTLKVKTTIYRKYDTLYIW